MIEKKFRWHAALDRLEENKTLKVAEIGVWRGVFSEQILINRPLVDLVQVDRWKAYTEEERKAENNSRMSLYNQRKFDRSKIANIKRIKNYRNRVQLLQVNSYDASLFIKDKSLDMAFLDALHSFAAVCLDIFNWYPKIKPGGWIGGHDYPRRPGVKKAVEEIFNIQDIQKDVDNTWFVRAE